MPRVAGNKRGRTLRLRFLDGDEPFEWPLAGTDLAAVCTRVADHTLSLLPAERQGLERMSDARRAAYSSGRRVAREALRELGVEHGPITARGRAPVWPDGVVGAITHSRELAVALVGQRRRYAGVGVDVEPEGRVGARVAERVLTDRERACLADEGWRTALFSAKEAVFKAVYPAVGEFLGFRDVELTSRGDTFEAATTGPCASTPWVAAGEGRLLRLRGHWLTTFIVPAMPI